MYRCITTKLKNEMEVSEQDRKRTLYVGGVNETVSEETLKAAFIAFGEIKDVQIPLDMASGKETTTTTTTRRDVSHTHTSTGKNRGFGFVQFEEIDDAEDAMDNMHNAELYGRVITVNIAKAQSIKLGYHRPVWADADNFYAKLKEDGGDTETDAQQSSKQAE